MKLLQTLSLGLVLAGSVGIGVYQAREIQMNARQIAQLNRDASAMEKSLERWRAASKEAPATEKMADTIVPASGDDAYDDRMRALVQKVFRLKKWIERTPGENVPELKFVPDSRWFYVAAQNLNLAEDHSLRRASFELRRFGQFGFLDMAISALNDYVKNSSGLLPKSMNDLAPLFVNPVDEAVLSRYEIAVTGMMREVAPNQPVIAQKLSPQEQASTDLITVSGVLVRVDSLKGAEKLSDQDRAIFQAMAIYQETNSGKRATKVEQLRPYVRDPSVLDGVTLDKYSDGFSVIVPAPEH